MKGHRKIFTFKVLPLASAAGDVFLPCPCAMCFSHQGSNLRRRQSVFLIRDYSVLKRWRELKSVADEKTSSLPSENSGKFVKSSASVSRWASAWETDLLDSFKKEKAKASEAIACHMTWVPWTEGRQILSKLVSVQRLQASPTPATASAPTYLCPANAGDEKLAASWLWSAALADICFIFYHWPLHPPSTQPKATISTQALA